MDREIEICVPSPSARLDILHKLLSRTPHKVTDNELKDVAYSAHGFVGADLASLCSRAAVHAIKRTNAGDGLCNIGSVAVDVEDLLWAMTQVKPSAMREVLIEVPNVRYTHNRSVFSYILTFLVSFFHDNGKGIFFRREESSFCSHISLDEVDSQFSLSVCFVESHQGFSQLFNI